MNTRFLFWLAPWALSLLSSCASDGVTPIRVAYCETHPDDPECPSVMRESAEKGLVVTDADRKVMADLQANREITEQRRRQWIAENSRYGLVIGAEVFDESSSTGATFANLGSAVAGANYVDRTLGNWPPTYRATDHLGAGIGGALVGSLLDSSERKFIIVYTVRYQDGSASQEVRQYRFRPAIFPVGSCVRIFPDGIELANQNSCKGF